MALCAKCGAGVTDGRKFCRMCGHAVADAPVQAPPPEPAPCAHCDAARASGVKFCRICGRAVGAPGKASPTSAFAASPVVPTVQAHPHEPERDLRATLHARQSTARQKARGWLYAGVAAVIALLIGTATYFALPYIIAPEPDATAIASALAGQLPPFMQITDTRLVSQERAGEESDPHYTVRFAATGRLAATVYLEGRVENDIVFLGTAAQEGTEVPLTGSAIVRRVDDAWQAQVALDPHRILEGAPVDAFPGRRVIVEGSAEDEAYRAEQARTLADAQAAQELEAARAALDAQLREATAARAEAQRQAAEMALRARLDAERRQAEENERQRVGERARIDAEHRAAADAERRREEEAAQAAAAARRTERITGRIPRNAETTVQLLSALSSDVAQVEQRFETVTTEDIVVRGRVLVPAGATVRGVIARVQRATTTNRTARLELSFDLITVSDQSVPIRARATRVLSGPGLKGDATRAGVAAGVGALIGGLLGGVQGAVIGGAVGGGGTLAATDGRQVELEAGSMVRIRFDEAVDFQ